MACRSPQAIANRKEYTRLWALRNPEMKRAHRRKSYRNTREKCLARMKDWAIRNPEKVRANQSRWVKAHPEVARASARVRAKRWNMKNPLKAKDMRLRHKYNVSLAEYNEILARQNNSCAICETPFTNPLHRHMDHNHTTNIPRGILCNFCNHALGNLRESVDLFYRAISYLENYSPIRETTF